MASPAVLLVSTESDISKQVGKIERLEANCEREKEAWRNAANEGQEAKAKILWEDAKEQLKAAQEELAALRGKEKILLGQLPTDQGLLSRLDHLQALSDVFGDLQLVNFNYTAGKVTKRVTTFSHDIKAVYGAAEGQYCWCLLTNAKLPYSTVIGAHLFKHEWSQQAHILEIDDINDLRNGLPLWKPLEWAFDTSRMVILYDKKDDAFRAMILDPGILDIKLADKGSQLGNWKAPARHLTSLRFRDIDGESLQFAPGNLHRPFRRCLNFQARQARREAIRQGWIAPQWDFPDFYSEGMSGAEKIGSWFRSMDNEFAISFEGPTTPSASLNSAKVAWSELLSSYSTKSLETSELRST